MNSVDKSEALRPPKESLTPQISRFVNKSVIEVAINALLKILFRKSIFRSNILFGDIESACFRKMTFKQNRQHNLISFCAGFFFPKVSCWNSCFFTRIRYIDF